MKRLRLAERPARLHMQGDWLPMAVRSARWHNEVLIMWTHPAPLQGAQALILLCMLRDRLQGSGSV